MAQRRNTSRSSRNKGKGKGSRFGGKVRTDAAEAKSKQTGYGYLKLPKGISLFKEKKGTLYFDIIPYIVKDKNHYDRVEENEVAVVGSEWYKKPILVHRAIGPDNTSLVCPRTQSKKCPICEERDRQSKSGDVDKEDMIKKPQLRNVYVIIPKKNKEYDEDFHIWDIANGNFQEPLFQELEERPQFENFPDPVDGYTLETRFSKESFSGNPYFEASRFEFNDRREPYDDEIMEEAPCLDDIVTVLSYKEIEKIFLALDDEDYDEEDEEDEDDRKNRRRHTGRRNKRHEEEEEEEDFEGDYDTEDEDDEEEDEEPKRGNRSRSSSRRGRDDEEEDEDDEEEEAPKRSRSRSRSTRSRRSSTRSRRSSTSKKCPAGGEFGDDWDEFNECDDCKLFKACGKAHADSE